MITRGFKRYESRNKMRQEARSVEGAAMNKGNVYCEGVVALPAC